MLQHRHGGSINSITAIEHETFKGVASWHFIGEVVWSDGTKSIAARIPPFALCGEPAEINPYMGKLNEYLERAGEWHEPKHKRDGRVYSWTPKAKEGREPVSL